MIYSKIYDYHLAASIHTFSVKTKSMPRMPNMTDMETIRISYMANTENWIVRINPNKLKGDIFAYSEFCTTVYALFKNLAIPECTFWRTDIRLDSYEDNFKAYHKLNLLLISLFSILFNDPNGQPVGHMLMQSKSFTDISSKNQYWEVKYYDKKFQTNDTDPAKARLEFRSLKSTKQDGHEPHEVKEIWFEKLDKLPTLYEELQRKCNEELMLAYITYRNYNGKSNAKRDLLTNFFLTYATGMSVFTRKQLKDFLLMCGVEKSKVSERAEYIYSKTNIEFFSKANLIEYIGKIKNSMDEFFMC